MIDIIGIIATILSIRAVTSAQRVSEVLYSMATRSVNRIDSHTLRSVNDVTEGSTQEAHMCAS